MELPCEKRKRKRGGSHAAPCWSRNGSAAGECAGGPGGPGEEQPAQVFHIPRKSKEKRALLESVCVESREFSDVLQILSSSYKDSSSSDMFAYANPFLVYNEALEKDFNEKRKELKQEGRTEKELSEGFCYLLCDQQKVSVVCERGLTVGSSWMNILGNPMKGVYLCRYSDILQICPIKIGSTGHIVIFKVIKGKGKSIHDSMPRNMDPTPKFDSHYSKNSTQVTSFNSHRAFEFTQQYFYEYMDFDISPRPRHVCPYAVVSFHLKQPSNVSPKPPSLLSRSSELNKGGGVYTVWQGDFLNGGVDVYHISLRSLSLPFLPYKLPKKIEVDKVMSLEQVKLMVPSALFSWNNYRDSHEVCGSGMYSSLLEVLEHDKSPKSLFALLQKLEEKGLVLVNMVNDRGFLFLLSASQMSNYYSRQSTWQMSRIQALFIYSEKRETVNIAPDGCKSFRAVESWSDVVPRHSLFVSALHSALMAARADLPENLAGSVEQKIYDYFSSLFKSKTVRLLNTDYNPKLDSKRKLFPAPRKKKSVESLLRSYLTKPSAYTILLAALSTNVEKLLSSSSLSGREAQAQDSPEKVKELLKLLQLNKNLKELSGTAEREGLTESDHTRPEQQRQHTVEELERDSEAQLSPRLQDTDLRNDQTYSVMKIFEVLECLKKSSLDTDLRTDAAQGAREVIKQIQDLTRGVAQPETENTPHIPTDRDIDLRKGSFDQPRPPASPEEEKAESLSSLEAFSPCSDSEGRPQGVNLLEGKTIPWVLIPITGLNTDRYDQGQTDHHQEDPRFLSNPTECVSDTTEQSLASPANHSLARPQPVLSEDLETSASPTERLMACVDRMVGEVVSGFSNEVEELLKNRHVPFVSWPSHQGKRDLRSGVPQLSGFASALNTRATPDAVCAQTVRQHIGSFHQILMVFKDSQCGEERSRPCEEPTAQSLPGASENTSLSAPPQQSALSDTSQHSRQSEVRPVQEDVSHTRSREDAEPSQCRDVPAENTNSTQLRPEDTRRAGLVELLKDVQTDTVHFYVHDLMEDESSFGWRTKVYLETLGCVDNNPRRFLEDTHSQAKLLVIIQNDDIATRLHTIPALVSLKNHPRVTFAGVEDDVQHHSYEQLFQSGGFVVSDESVLNPDLSTPEKLLDILCCIEKQNCTQNPWIWRLHLKAYRKLKEISRFKPDALKMFEILNTYEKKGIVEMLPYHDCDAPRKAPDINCLVALQTRFIKHRHLVFLTGSKSERFQEYARSGVVTATHDDFCFTLRRLAGEERTDI